MIKRVNINILIETKNITQQDYELTKPIFDNEDFVLMSKDTDMFDILTKFKLFKSRGQARKNWKKTDKNIPEGFSHFQKIGKLNHEICIFKPIEE